MAHSGGCRSSSAVWAVCVLASSVPSGCGREAEAPLPTYPEAVGVSIPNPIRPLDDARGSPTRHGHFPFCDVMRLPSYWTAKSAFAGLGFLRLGQKYGPEIADLLLRDTLPELREDPARYPGWEDVTIENVLDLASEVRYKNGFWGDPWGPGSSRSGFACPFWTSKMGGYGGIEIWLLPNGTTDYFFSDGGTTYADAAVAEADRIASFCR